ncbi:MULTISPECIES: terpene synthase family protein [unclassified Streptomyces]|uniref:terpene synthase family protein n=1 Tax=unclassified Streptomyces TaxID=2593676 RepID=UPI0022544F7D|nr:MULTISPECIES: terpene synthase family protein [unclassified Streptomyces]MCX4633081.1 terpene synthase family protein [Streptomyces sp. NBC_01443]
MRDVSPYSETLAPQYSTWCDQLVHLPEEGRERYRRQRLDLAAAYCFPRPLSHERALITALHTLWLTHVDDYFGMSPHSELVSLARRVAELLDGAQPHSDEHPVLRMIADVRARAEKVMPPAWLSRFSSVHRDFILTGMDSEAPFKLDNRVPSLAELEEFRPYSIGMYPWCALVELELGVPLPDHIATHPVLRQIMHLLARMTAWQNDAYSMAKEIPRSGDGETINLAFVLQHERGLGLEDACDEMYRIYAADAAKFTALVDALPDFGPHQQAVERVVHHMALAASGLHTWYQAFGATRYSDDGWVGGTDPDSGDLLP